MSAITRTMSRPMTWPLTGALGNDPGQGGSTLGVVAVNRCQLPTTVTSIPQNFTSQRAHWASSQGAVTNLRCKDINWYLNDTFVPTGGAASLTFKRYIEYPSGSGVFHRVTWSGGDLTIAAGSNVSTSDVILSSVTGLPLVISAGAKCRVRTVKISATSQNVPIIETPAGATTLGLDDGNDVTDKGNSGTISATAGVNTFGPLAIVGDILAAGAKSFALPGDSLFWGFGDVTGADSKFNSGWIARAVGQSYPYVKIAKNGWSASDLAGSAAAALTNLFAALPVTDAVFGFGINDLRLGRTKAQLLADFQTNYARYGSDVRKWQITLGPRADSSNSYADVAGQTPKTDGNMADLTPVNTDIRGGLANLAGYVDSADFVMSARDSNVFGGPFPPTTDGTHLTTAKAAAAAALYTP